MNKYIILSDGTDSYRFRVQVGGYRPIRRKHSNIKYTVTGKVDHQYGSINLEWNYGIMVADVDPATGTFVPPYGTLENLKDLFDRNTSETNTLTLTDHYEDEHGVYMIGEFSEEPMSGNLSGTCAWFIVPVHLLKVEAE